MTVYKYKWTKRNNCIDCSTISKC